GQAGQTRPGAGYAFTAVDPAGGRIAAPGHTGSAAGDEARDVVACDGERGQHGPRVGGRVVSLRGRDVGAAVVASDRVQLAARRDERMAATSEMHRGQLSPVVGVEPEHARTVASLAVASRERDA